MKSTRQRIAGSVAVAVVLLGVLAPAAPSARAQATSQEGTAVPVTTTVIDQPGNTAEWPVPLRVERRGLLTTKVGHGCLATLPDEVERVALADDSIARVQIISPRELLITGLRPGETTLHVWLTDGRRLLYRFRTERDMDLLNRTLKDLDPRIHAESSTDSSSIVLRGEVANRETAREASRRATAVLAAAGGRARILNLLHFPGAALTIEEELQELLHSIDTRIRVRRIQVGEDTNVAADTFVLEGRVRTIENLVRVVMLAERKLGGTGGQVGSANQDDSLNADRFRGNSLSGVAGGFSGGGLGGQRGLGGSDPRSNSLAAQVARGQVITSESGRVISLLEVEELHQVMVSIRVMEVDRAKARKAGISFRVDADNLSIGSYTGPGVGSLPDGGSAASVSGLGGELGNIVGAFVDQTQAIVTAIDFLQEKNFARSVAEPNVLTLSGELASISVGGEVPIPSTAATSVSTFSGVAFQSFGVRLDIRPTVTGEDMVTLEVAPSISRPVGASVNGIPSFTVQSVSTTARVQAGQSLLIGGLLSFEEGLEDRRVPGLGRIPLFRWKRKTRSDRELLFLITPRLVRIAREQRADAVVDPTPDLDELQLPDVRWPDDRKHWRDAFEPRRLPADGIPESFRIAPAEPLEPWLQPTSDGMAPQEPFVDPYASVAPGTGSAWEVAPAPARFGVVGERARPCLNLRPLPGFWEGPKGCLQAGTHVELLEQGVAWSRVHVTEDGRSGWVATSYLELETAAESDAGPDAEQEGTAAVVDSDGLALRAAEAEAEQERLERELEELEAAVEEVREDADPPVGDGPR